MKKYLLGAASLLLVAAAAIGGYSYYQDLQTAPSILENLEALSVDESSSGVTGPSSDSYCGAHNTNHTRCGSQPNHPSCTQTTH